MSLRSGICPTTPGAVSDQAPSAIMPMLTPSVGIRIFMASARSTPVGRDRTDVLITRDAASSTCARTSLPGPRVDTRANPPCSRSAGPLTTCAAIGVPQGHGWRPEMSLGASARSVSLYRRRTSMSSSPSASIWARTPWSAAWSGSRPVSTVSPRSSRARRPEKAPATVPLRIPRMRISYRAPFRRSRMP